MVGWFVMKKKKMLLLNQLLIDVLNAIKEERTSAFSLWSSDMLNFVEKEFNDLSKAMSFKGIVEWKSQKGSMLESVYLMADSLLPLNNTHLGQAISRFDREFVSI